MLHFWHSSDYCPGNVCMVWKTEAKEGDEESNWSEEAPLVIVVACTLSSIKHKHTDKQILGLCKLILQVPLRGVLLAFLRQQL